MCEGVLELSLFLRRCLHVSVPSALASEGIPNVLPDGQVYLEAHPENIYAFQGRHERIYFDFMIASNVIVSLQSTSEDLAGAHANFPLLLNSLFTRLTSFSRSSSQTNRNLLLKLS